MSQQEKTHTDEANSNSLLFSTQVDYQVAVPATTHKIGLS
jgi:hypothetical protein